MSSLFIQFHGQCLEQSLIDDKSLFIDGAKFEANANKYTFVWKRSIQNYEIKMKNYNWEYLKSKINQRLSEPETKKSTVKSKRTNPLYMDWYFCI